MRAPLLALLTVGLAAVTLLSRTPGETAIQSFSPVGVAAVDWRACYGGAAPVDDGAGEITCGAGSSETMVPRNTLVAVYEAIELPPGARLGKHSTFTPADGSTEWQPASVICGPLDGNGECTAGTAAGDVTARLDIGCDLGHDVVATAGAGGDPALWPDGGLWTPETLTRTSASGALGGGGAPTGGPNAYAHQLLPFATSGPNAYGFRSADSATLDTLYLDGDTPASTPGGTAPLHLLTYRSPYAGQAGLDVTVAVSDGDPARPPDDSFVCREGPQDSVVGVNYLTTPDADRIIPRWSIITSNPDLQGSEIDRILDWGCVVIGAGEPDGDGDCLADAGEPPAASCAGGVNDQDCDNDLVPDGVEVYTGSSTTLSDTDGDGATDYDEIFQFTDPANVDSDGDGQRDRLDDTPTNFVGTFAGDDAPGTGTDAAGAAPHGIMDDNCPSVSNADQRNTDSMYRFHGHPPSFTSPGNGTGDTSNPDEDIPGDACDQDDDNDDVNDITEAAVTIIPWSGFADPGGECVPLPSCSTSGDLADTTVCAGPGVGILSDYVDTHAEDGFDYTGHLNPTLGDVDQDYFLDGRECQFRSRPDQSIRNNVLAENCNVSPTVPLDNGCAQPATNTVGAGGGDEMGGGDLLFLPGGGPASHIVVERFFRTVGITTAAGVQTSDLELPQPTCTTPLPAGDGLSGDMDRDSDRDMLCPQTPNSAFLLDGYEVLIHGTSPTAFDTDQDGCPDMEEVADVNGDGIASSIDLGLIRNKQITIGPAMDNNADGFIDDYTAGVNYDVNKNTSIESIDLGITAGVLAAPQSCISIGVGWENSISIGRATQGLP